MRFLEVEVQRTPAQSCSKLSVDNVQMAEMKASDESGPCSVSLSVVWVMCRRRASSEGSAVGCVTTRLLGLSA